MEKINKLIDDLEWDNDGAYFPENTIISSEEEDIIIKKGYRLVTGNYGIHIYRNGA